jgi:hypothetical protein
MYLCVFNQDGAVLLNRNTKLTPEPFLKAIAPYREDLVVCGVDMSEELKDRTGESIHTDCLEFAILSLQACQKGIS